MKRLRLEGTLMNKDIPLFKFSFEEHMYCTYTVLNDNLDLYPWDLNDGIDDDKIVDFFIDRQTPPTRIGLNQDMIDAGLGPYDLTVLMRHQNASAVDNTFWVRFENEGPQTWEELRKKIGFTFW